MLGDLRRLRPGVEPDRLPAPDTYLTDERRLFRVVIGRVIADDALVELEDCGTLDVWLVPLAELETLRAVRPVAAIPPPPVAADRSR